MTNREKRVTMARTYFRTGSKAFRTAYDDLGGLEKVEDAKDIITRMDKALGLFYLGVRELEYVAGYAPYRRVR